MTKHYQYFSHKECEFFPCHAGADKDNFNCLFCYCPLYLTKDCGGAFTYTKEGVKDCSHCLFPHKRENYEKIIQKLMEAAKK
jgi:Zn-finger protein